MPFVSKKQQRKCYAMKGKGQNGSWDCDEFAHVTNFKSLPEKAASTKLASELGRLAARH